MATKKQLRKLDQNSLEELQALTNQLIHRIEDYSHVSEYLPKPIRDGLKKFVDDMDTEQIRREED